MNYDFKKWAESVWLAASIVLGVMVTAAVPPALELLANYDPTQPLAPAIGVAVGASVRTVGGALLALWASQRGR